MYDLILKELAKRDAPIDVIVVGLGFMGFGFLSSSQYTCGIRVPLVLTRRPEEAVATLTSQGFLTRLEDNPAEIKAWADKGYICVSADLGLIGAFDNEIVVEMTGTVAYGTQVALSTLSAGKHLVTMNPELQATVGYELKEIADKKGLVITDVIGDQPGSIARLISQARLMGFRVLMAGNMKRYLNRHATQEEMKAWAESKGLAVRQTTSFTDGTKQAIEMNLVANYFDMDTLEFGMKGPRVDDIKEALTQFDWSRIPAGGIVDYVIGKNLFPGVFIIAEHSDNHQKGYLSYLGLGQGPRYVLFEPYHLCHLEVAGTIAKVVLFGQESIHNKVKKTKTIAVAKQTLIAGMTLDGIGGDMIYGNIDQEENAVDYLPVGVSEGAVIKVKMHQDQPIKLSDVELPVNAATRLLGLVPSRGADIDNIIPALHL